MNHSKTSMSPIAKDTRTEHPLRGMNAWVFDLDNTLYPRNNDIFAQVGARMRVFIMDLLGVDEEGARAVQKDYLRKFGTTLRGLMTLHDLEPGPYLDNVHDIDLTPIAPNPALGAALGALKGRKLIFTNATTHHAERVLARLGIADHFEDIFDIVAADYLPKPDPAVYQSLIERYHLDASKTVMFEDIARNLEPAAALSMTTVWVETDSDWAGDGADEDHVHHRTDDLVGLLQSVVV
jgi:putative hydrolase of the HAD superfamily